MKSDLPSHIASSISEPMLGRGDPAPEPAGLRYPPQFQRFDPEGPYDYMLYCRPAIAEVTDSLYAGEVWKKQTFGESCGPSLPISVTVDTRRLADLLVVKHCTRASLVVYLPPELEPCIAEMASSKPNVMNRPTADLLHHQAFLSFCAGQGKNVRSISPLHDAIYRDNAPCRGANGVGDFFAVVLVAGNSVAIGGYICAKDYADEYGFCFTLDQSDVAYSEEELADTALWQKNVGNWPTAYLVHRWSDTGIASTAAYYSRAFKRDS
jgi:hypothetical protein